MYKLGIIIGDNFEYKSFNLKRQKFHLGQFVWVKSVYGVTFSKSDKKSFRIPDIINAYEIYDIKREYSCLVNANEIYLVKTGDIFYSHPNDREIIDKNEKRGTRELQESGLVSCHIEKSDGILIRPENSYFTFRTFKEGERDIYFNEIDNYNYFPIEEVYVGFHFENQEKEYIFKMPMYLYTYFTKCDILNPIKVCIDNNFDKFAYSGNKLIFTAVYTSCPDENIDYKTITGYYTTDITQRFILYNNVQNTIFDANQECLDVCEILLGTGLLHVVPENRTDIQNLGRERAEKIVTTLCPHFASYKTNWDRHEESWKVRLTTDCINSANNKDTVKECNCISDKYYIGTYQPAAELHVSDKKIEINLAESTDKNNAIAIAKDCINSYAELNSELNTVASLGTFNTGISTTTKTINKKKGENKMKNIFDNFKFGKYEDGNIAYSIKGMAYYTDQLDWVSLGEDGSLTKVNDFIIDGMDKFIYVMPVAINNIKKGDIILHHDAPMFVRTVLDNSLTVISPTSAEVKQIIPEKNIFGFNFVSKIVDITNGVLFNNANKDNPFGNLLPFMLMSDDNSSMKDILPFMLMQNNNFGDMNPMMLAFMMKDKNMDNILPLMFMQNQNLFNLQTIDNSIKEEVEETKDKNEEESSIKMGFQG